MIGFGTSTAESSPQGISLWQQWVRLRLPTRTDRSAPHSTLCTPVLFVAAGMPVIHPSGGRTRGCFLTALDGINMNIFNMLKNQPQTTKEPVHWSRTPSLVHHLLLPTSACSSGLGCKRAAATLWRSHLSAQQLTAGSIPFWLLLPACTACTPACFLHGGLTDHTQHHDLPRSRHPAAKWKGTVPHDC